MGDSNPRYGIPYVSLANWWFQPLTQPSLRLPFQSAIHQTDTPDFFKCECKGNIKFSFLQIFTRFFITQKYKSPHKSLFPVVSCIVTLLLSTPFCLHFDFSKCPTPKLNLEHFKTHFQPKIGQISISNYKSITFRDRSITSACKSIASATKNPTLIRRLLHQNHSIKITIFFNPLTTSPLQNSQDSRI